MSHSFSLTNSDERIFLHAVDGNFENSQNFVNKTEAQPQNFDVTCDKYLDEIHDDDIHNVNVKFILSLDEEENFNDLSTEEGSEAEDNLRDSIASSGDNIQIKGKFSKIYDFLKEDLIKSGIEKIKSETVTNMRTYQIQIQNKMLMMKQYYDNLYKMNSMGVGVLVSPLNLQKN